MPHIKQTWLYKIKKTCERWKKNLSSNPADQQQQQVPFVQMVASSQPPISNQHQVPSTYKIANEQRATPSRASDSNEQFAKQGPRASNQDQPSETRINQAPCVRLDQSGANGQQTIELIVTAASSNSPDHSAATSMTQTASAH